MVHVPRTFAKVFLIASSLVFTQKIRKSIIADKSLSTDAHNVKIIARDGKITFRGLCDQKRKKRTSKPRPLR